MQRLGKCVLGCLAASAALTVFGADVVQGVVAVGEGGCKKRDLLVIYAATGFVIAEQYSGSFNKDDTVFGELNSYGMKDVLVNGRAGRLYVDDHALTRERASEKCFKD